MSEKLSEVFEQYDMEIISTRKGRGSTILNTTAGMRILEPFRGSMVRLEQEYVLKQLFYEQGLKNLDYIIPNRDGQLFTCDKYRQPFVMKQHFDGAECDMHNPDDLVRAVEALAQFHEKGQRVARDFEVKWSESRRKKEEQRVEEIRQVLEDGEEMERITYLYEISQSELEKAVEQEKKCNAAASMISPLDQDSSALDIQNRFKRHNAQIRKIQRFVSRVKRRNSFENLFLTVCPEFYQQGVSCVELLEQTGAASVGVREGRPGNHYGICHGSFNQHNVILGEDITAIVHFERFSRGNQLDDLYQFCRKAMEKNHFDFEMLLCLLETYADLISLEASDYEYLYVLFSYPEKFWKIANSYYNSSKAFLSPKYLEKLNTLICQEKEKQEMLGSMKRIVLEQKS